VFLLIKLFFLKEKFGYNDGTPIELEKIDLTVQEIVEKFGGCRITSGIGIPAFNGYWVNGEALYRDAVKSLIVEAPQTNRNFEFLNRLKKTLEQRFEQAEIYMTILEIKRIVSSPQTVVTDSRPHPGGEQ